MAGQRRRAADTAVRGLTAPEGAVWNLPRRERNYTILTFILGLLVFAVNGFLLGNDPDLDLTMVGLIGGLFAAIIFTPGIKVRRGDEYVDYKFWEYPIIVGLALGPAYLVAVCLIVAFGVTTAYTYVTTPERRTRIPVDFGAMCVAGTVGIWLAVVAEPYSYPAGCLLLVIVWELAFFGYDATRGGFAYARQAISDGWAKRFSLPLILSVIVAALVFVLGPQREFLLLAPLSVLGLYWFAQSRMESQEEKAAWRQMESVSSQFIGELDENKAIALALRQSLGLFSARHAEIVLHGDGIEAGSRWSLTAGPNMMVEVSYLGQGEPIPDPPRATTNSTIFALSMGERDFGYMVLEWDPMAPQKRSRRSLINTFGHSVSASVANTRHNKHIRNQAAEKAREAEHDPLTGMGNRARLASRGPVALTENEDIGRRCALLLFDLDGFKRINDTLGHAAGDEVLAEVARRIQRTVRKSDLAIRLGGDEFAVLAGDMEMSADAELLAAKISRALIPPIEIQDLQLSVEASIGVAMYPEDATDINSLLKLADIAMYRSKQVGRGKMTRYSKSINFETTESLRLATDLRRAIVSATELVLHYQPQVNLKTGEVTGVEALVRWNHPKLGMLSPDRFVHIAERSNLVRPFTIAILEKALIARMEMRALMPKGTVAVNLSAQNLLDSGLPRDVARLLTKYEVNPSELVLEVTETTTATDLIAAERVLTDLADLGCRIAMDDFGTGYATMDSLRAGSRVGEIKMDRGFVKDIAANERDRRVAAAIVEIAHAWDCQVVAEGIEDEVTFNLLRDMGCDIAQGYWLSRPAPLPEILDWVARRQQTEREPQNTSA